MLPAITMWIILSKIITTTTTRTNLPTIIPVFFSLSPSYARINVEILGRG